MTASPATRRPVLPLHWKMGIGFAVGLLLGLAVYYLAGSDAEWVRLATKYVTTPFSQVFLNLIFMLIVPLLFSALVMGISEMGDIRALGRVGWRTLGYTVVLSGVAVVPGVGLGNGLKAGAGVDPSLATQLIPENAGRTPGPNSPPRTHAQGLDMVCSRAQQRDRRGVEQRRDSVADVFLR
ncbi:dicarboxylate/amino acid:cation symporter [Xanthomonas citri]|uniref:dicarboxylate/amino acid:cation symporter n=1 Tax=Xanthomonas citri TaxID=346 RepID=UPI0023685089|nr:cation:dicarboxylase symporter family transporter [Xanthomonas citri]